MTDPRTPEDVKAAVEKFRLAPRMHARDVVVNAAETGFFIDRRAMTDAGGEIVDAIGAGAQFHEMQRHGLANEGLYARAGSIKRGSENRL